MASQGLLPAPSSDSPCGSADVTRHVLQGEAHTVKLPQLLQPHSVSIKQARDSRDHTPQALWFQGPRQKPYTVPMFPGTNTIMSRD